MKDALTFFTLRPLNEFALLLCRVSLVFLKRNDAHNCVRAANLGLTLADRRGLKHFV